MSTNGGFNPPSDPACVIPVDRAALIALRAANGLDIQCHYLVTDGPVIGTAGNTSPTQILMHAVSTSELSTNVSVNTTFGGTADVWPGGYDIDLGTQGSIYVLVDDFNNRVSDSDPDAPTVHTQFPWHARGTRLRDNVVDDSVLVGWSAAHAAGCTLVDNSLRETTVNLTGKTSGTFVRNNVVTGFINALVATSFIENNQMTSAVVDHQGTGAGSFSYQNNVMLTGTVTADAATTAQLTMNNNVFGGTAGGYRVSVESKVTGLVIVSGNRLFNAGGGSADLIIRGSAVVTATSNDIGAGTITIENSGATTLSSNKFIGAIINKLGTGATDISRNTLTTGTITQNATSSATLTMQDNTQEQASITLAAGSAGQVIISSGNTGSITLNHQGQGSVQLYANNGHPVIITAVGSARGTVLNSNTGRFSVNQNGTGSANLDTVLGSFVQDGTVNFNSTLAGTGPNTVAGTIDGQATVNVQDGAGPTVMSQTRVGGLSVLNIDPGGSVSRCRFDCDITVNTGAFSHINSIAEGDFVLTPTTSNTNKLLNKAYSDWV